MSFVAKAAGVVLFAGVCAGFARGADAVGRQLPDAKLEGFAQTKAKTLDDFFGRTVLIEAFAYW